MIRIRARPATPGTLRSPKVAQTMRSIRRKVTAGSDLDRKDFPSHWLEDDVRICLWRHQHSKCCYCERKREAKREPDIDHFRPKGRIKEEGRRHSGYWWLAYEWTNLFFSCKPCNQLKSNRFPLVGGKRARTPEDRLADEMPALIDPIMGAPEDLVDYRWEFASVPLAKPIGKDDGGRGDTTIRLLGLGRSELNEQRGLLLLFLKGIATKMMAAQHFGNPELREDARKDILRATMAENEFAGFRRAYFGAVGLGEYVAND